jgi:hypothetical protein
MSAASYARILGLLATATLSACQIDDDPDPGASMAPLTPAPPRTERDLPPSMPAWPPPDDGMADAYDTMCAHYCGALEKTMVYTCLETRRDADSCIREWQGHAQTCFDLRCVPRKVYVAFCLRQCDALDSAYGRICAAPAPGRGPLCPLSPADHDRDCRAGCVLPDAETSVQTPGGSGRV